MPLVFQLSLEYVRIILGSAWRRVSMCEVWCAAQNLLSTRAPRGSGTRAHHAEKL